MNFLSRIYTAFLHLYPPAFRDEFADEMQTVFAHTIADAAKRGNAALIRICLKELCDVPFTAFHEYWHSGRKSSMENKTRISPLELLTIATPFLIYLAVAITETVQISWSGVVTRVLLGALIVVSMISLFKGLTRWALPMWGLFLAIFNFILFNLLSPILEVLGPLLPFLGGIVGSGLPYIGIIILTLITILAIALIRPWHPLFLKIQQDYTLLPLMLYGIMPLETLIGFDDYQGEGLYKIGMALALIACLWLYLRSTQSKRKLFWLGIGVTLAMAIEAIGKWIIVPSQDWRVWFALHTIEQAQHIEVTSTVYTWFWMMAIVLLPALLGLLPRSTRLTSATQP